jgi:hypothetical protein
MKKTNQPAKPQLSHPFKTRGKTASGDATSTWRTVSVRGRDPARSAFSLVLEAYGRMAGIDIVSRTLCAEHEDGARSGPTRPIRKPFPQQTKNKPGDRHENSTLR